MCLNEAADIVPHCHGIPSGEKERNVGDLLRIDLTSGVVREETLAPELIREYIGGKGIGTWLLSQEVGADVEPLSPQNKLIFALGPTAGDYWRKFIPWNAVPGWDGFDQTPPPPGTHVGDVPMYSGDPDDPTNLQSFAGEITTWCYACHRRYLAGSTAPTTPSGDAIFKYRHPTASVECTQCHVAHGSNAAMTGEGATDFSNQLYPDGVTRSLSSRLLKIDNRGTCQACHDPTGTIPYTTPITITH